MSKTEATLTQEIKGECVKTDLDELEIRLRNEVFLSGEDLGEEDRKVYETYKDQEICKQKYPNLFKWKKIIAKFNTSTTN
jgi:hypothetical protein